MRTIFTVIFTLTCGLVAPRVWAEIYTCKDAAGHILTSDRPIPECATRSMYVRKNVEQSAREIPPPLTPEERRKADEEQEKKKNEMLVEEQRKKEDQNLLANFRSESDIEQARQRSLEFVNAKIRASNEQIKAINEMQTELKKEPRGNQKTAGESADSQRRASQLAAAIKTAQSANGDYEAEQARINKQFDETLKRYREIVQRRKK